MGFTVTQTTIEAGMEIEVRYENHLEACFCVEGELEIEDLETGASPRRRSGNDLRARPARPSLRPREGTHAL